MITAENITKRYMAEGVETSVLHSCSLELAEGEFAVLVGRSGSGKSTLLNVLSSLLRPDEGRVLYQGRELWSLDEKELRGLRRNDFAVVFQFHYLMPYLTALENVVLPFMQGVGGVPAEIVDRAVDCLDRVGLRGKEKKLPGSLSGGEQQRVAIARALVKSARVLFADEPTGSLDRATGQEVMELLSGLHDEGMTILMVTHEQSYAQYAGRILTMEDGRLLQ
ncbi:MAG: ABC transporter ATP-binding protein [Deltaproteobacteria bacterium]|nr:ABC transporter ATP-binding protein [Deltaproteobacteria bacterium]